MITPRTFDGLHNLKSLTFFFLDDNKLRTIDAETSPRSNVWCLPTTISLLLKEEHSHIYQNFVICILMETASHVALLIQHWSIANTPTVKCTVTTEVNPSNVSNVLGDWKHCGSGRYLCVNIDRPSTSLMRCMEFNLEPRAFDYYVADDKQNKISADIHGRCLVLVLSVLCFRVLF